jgi:hypothetical protein
MAYVLLSLLLNKAASMDMDEDQPVQPATLLSYEEVRPQSFQGRRKSSRVQEYRRKLRKRRNRKIALTIASIATALSLGIAYKINHPEFSFQSFFPVEDLNVTFLDDALHAAANSTQELVAKLIGNATAREEPKEVPTKKKERKKVEKKMEVPVVKEEPNPVPTPPVVETPNAQPTPIQPEKHTSTQVELVAKKEEEDASAFALAPRRERRPILCNIPLAYLILPRCRRLARENPIFNLQKLVQDMMQ